MKCLLLIGLKLAKNDENEKQRHTNGHYVHTVTTISLETHEAEGIFLGK